MTHNSTRPTTASATPEGENDGRFDTASPRTGRRPQWPSPLQKIGYQFADLDAAGACTVNGSDIEGLPNRELGIGEVRSRLLHPSTPFTTRNAALDWLIARLHTGRGDWTLALTGILLPGLQAALLPVHREHPTLRFDIETEALLALWMAATRLEPGRRKIAARLIGPARRAATHYARTERDTLKRATAAEDDPAFRPGLPANGGPAGHPDFVLAAAVSAGVLLAEDADLIALTRLEDVTLEAAAARLAISYDAAAKRRTRAEAHLVSWIRRGQSADDNTPGAAAPAAAPTRFVQNGAEARPCSSGGRPRQGRRLDHRSGAHQPTTQPPRR